ncbi:MAG TPA: metal ABC transporter substrate-binding protein [Eoetvoesiella sp.]
MAIPVTGFAQKAPAAQNTPIKVVASFSILGDMAREIGGEYIQLTTIVGAGADAHSFEPTPKDAKALAQAKVLVVNGLGFEEWLPRLVKSSGFAGTEIVASKGVRTRHLSNNGSAHDGHGHAGDIDPHAWQSLENGMVYARNIADGLSRADPAHAKDYQGRAQLYIASMKKLDTEIKQALKAIPEARRKVVTSHDSFGYFQQAYGVQFISVAGFSSDAEPSAKEVAAIIDQIKREKVPAVFVESITNQKLIRQIGTETRVKVGGTLYSDALAKSDEPAGTYLGMFTWNAGRLIYALQPDVKEKAETKAN